MGEFNLYLAVVQDAIRELQSLAVAAVVRAMGDPVELPAQLQNLAAFLTPEDQVPSRVLQRGRRMNRAMPFAVFEPTSPLQHRVLASGLAPGLVERLPTRWRRSIARVPPGWTDAILLSALSAPTFLAQTQGIAYRGLRTRVFFAPGGPPVQPISAETFLVLIVWSGRPTGLSQQGWARLEDLARQAADRPAWAGPADRLLLAEARNTFGRAGTDVPGGEEGIEYVPG